MSKEKMEGFIHIMPMLVGVCVGTVMYVALSAIMALLARKGTVSEGSISSSVNVCRFFSSFCAAVSAGLLAGKKKAIYCFGASIGVMVIWLTISTLYLDTAVVGLTASCISSILGSFASLLLIITKIHQGRGGYKKKHYR